MKDVSTVENATNSKNTATWGVGQQDRGYHRGFANVMKLSVILQAFISPLLVWLFLGLLIIKATENDDIGIAGMIIGYAVTAFSLWFSLSYKAKLFDNISKLAENSEQILKQMTKEDN